MLHNQALGHEEMLYCHTTMDSREVGYLTTFRSFAMNFRAVNSLHKSVISNTNAQIAGNTETKIVRMSEDSPFVNGKCFI